MLRLASLTLLVGQVGGQFGGFFGSFMSQLPPLPPLPSIPSGLLPTGLPVAPDTINQVLAGSVIPGIPSLPPERCVASAESPLCADPIPSGLDEFLNNLLAGSPLPAALPSGQDGPYMAILNGSPLPHGMVPTEYEGMFNNIVHGSPLPDSLQGYQGAVEGVMAGSALPTRRMPTIPGIPGMPSIDMGQYQDIFGQLFDSMKGMFAGVDVAPADLLKELEAQGFAVPSIDPQALLSNRDDYLAKLREQFQKLAEKLREKGLVDKFQDLRGELQDVLGGKKNLNISEAGEYLDQIGGLVGGLSGGVLNSTLQGALRNISMGDVHDSLRRIGSLVAGQTEKFEKMTADFQFAAKKLQEGVENVMRFNNSAVGLPPLPFLNQTLTMVEWAGNPYGVRDLNSSVVSVMLSDAASGNETLVRGLEQLINITIPLLGGGSADGSVPECVYWNTSVADWLADGCRVQDASDGSVTCGCNHLTDFAVIMVGVAAPSPSPSASAMPVVATASAAAPAPSPAILLVGAAAPGPQEAKDIKPLIGGVVGGVAGTLLLSIIAANLWDRRKKARKSRKVVASAPPTFVNPTHAIVTMV